ncbi:MAG: TetR/AcrR family transcriptional regulator [Aureispira sp.]
MPAQKTTREEIIEKSIQLFRQEGYHKTSMSDLAAVCGLQKGSFYHYFKNKEALMQAVLERLHEYYHKKVFSIAYEADKSAEERFVALFKKQEPIISADFSGCLFGNMTLESSSNQVDFSEPLKAFFSDWQAAFQQLYQEQYAPEKALQLARQSVAEVEGALMLMRLYEDRSYLRSACERILERLRQGTPRGASQKENY